jgi:3-isopropylmalate/(R)-2-methylmalate dehydratase small subunit
MQKFDQHKGIAAPMDILNIDTDMIIPKQFLKTIKRTGLGANLFDEMRFDKDGNELPNFVLNKEPYRDASIIIAGDNFGCGSSREHAPWALLDFGIRCVVSTSFADIFYNNCFKNGILPVVVSADDRDALMADAADAENPELDIDLVNQVIRRPNGGEVKFDIDPFRKQCLLDGLDDIGLTMEKGEKIKSYAEQRQHDMPWL